MIVILSGTILVQCAKQGTPAGGPKDEDPPELIAAVPPERSVNFAATKITLTFNEFIQLKNPGKEIFISPPMKVKPEYKVQGKKLLIDFQEELQKNSTYTINFGNAIVDYSESNAMVNFEYVFSTGSHLDSLFIAGQVLNAFNHEPEKEIMVMVYRDDNDTIPLDSLPLKVPPKNASKSTKDGHFSVNNLAPGEYKLFALEDVNNNFIFDMPNERIAFLDSMVTLTAPDTASLEMDTVNMPADTAVIMPDSNSIAADTAVMLPDTNTIAGQVHPSFSVIPEKSYTLYLFQEIDSTQRITGKKLSGSNLLQYTFKRPVDSIAISPVDFTPGQSNWYICEYGKLRDTVNFWLRPGLPDTIRVCVSYGDTIADTSRFILTRPDFDKTLKRKGTLATTMDITPNTMAGNLDMNKEFTLNFKVPVMEYDTARIILNAPGDTLIPSILFTDTIMRQAVVNYPWKQDETYQVIVYDSAFKDLTGAYNDSTSLRLKIRKLESYGILVMVITAPVQGEHYIIQLLTDKQFFIQERIITSNSPVRFEYLLPGTYKMKVIYDANGNGQWDAGNYRAGIMPEKVDYYNLPITIRANWDQQEEWQLKE